MLWHDIKPFKLIYKNIQNKLDGPPVNLVIKALRSITDWSVANKTLLITGLIWPFHLLFYFISINLLSEDMFDIDILSSVLLAWLGVISFIFCISAIFSLNGSSSRLPIYLLVTGYGTGMFVFVYLFGTMGSPYVAYYITSILVILVVYDSKAGSFALVFVILANIAMAVGESEGYLPHAPAINTRSIDALHNSSWTVTAGIWCIMSLIFIYYLVRILVISRENIIHQLRHSQKEIEYMSKMDALTNVANRRYFDEELSKAITYAKLTQQPLALIFCDADYFKSINDRFGHHMGDEVLKILALILASQTRQFGFVARFGGEEFVILLPNIPQQKAVEIAEELRRSIAEFQDMPVSTHITASFGVACWFRGDDSDTLLKKADLALYQAKDTGRNKVCLYKQPEILLAS